MTERRSARAATKAPVKYTSDSEASNFGEKAVKKPNKKATQFTRKKGTKRHQSPNDETEPTPKRRRMSPDTLATEHALRSKTQEEKAAKRKAKQLWEDWLSGNNVSGKLLDAGPEREDCVTQTDAQKQYGLKANELITIEHFEKPNQYGGQTKLFPTTDVEKVAFQKYGLLAGFTDKQQILEKGEELWKSEHSIDAQSFPEKPKRETAPKSKTPKQKWAAYIKEHSVGDRKLSEEPENSINQTDSKTYYQLLPLELACLPHFPKPNQKYGNTTKLFSKGDVQKLAYRKAAIVAGIETTNTEECLRQGKDLLESAVKASET